MNFSFTSQSDLGSLQHEVIERKGIGHPDTLTDALAERMSAHYAQYTLERYGVILHHNFDKLHMLGGATELDFGGGRLIRPIRIIMNGRASASFAGEQLPVQYILGDAARSFFHERFPELIDPARDLEFHWLVSTSSSPGRTKRTTGARAHMFNPRTVEEVKGYDGPLVNNDTSMGCGYAPYSVLEGAVLGLETDLNSSTRKTEFPWLGTDIKVMAIRQGVRISITACLPQIASKVASERAYQENLATLDRHIKTELARLLRGAAFELRYNTRDNNATGDYYLTVTGSSLESGDEGVVGRGNRINGLITPFRPMNLEGVCGKNPLYHTGKLYNIVAQRIAQRVYQETGLYCEAYLVGQSGQALLDPWSVTVRSADTHLDEATAQAWAVEEIQQLPAITQALVKQELTLW